MAPLKELKQRPTRLFYIGRLEALSSSQKWLSCEFCGDRVNLPEEIMPYSVSHIEVLLTLLKLLIKSTDRGDVAKKRGTSPRGGPGAR